MPTLELNESVRVLFRYDLKQHDTFALLPDLPGDGRVHTCECFTYWGHTSADLLGSIQSSRPALPAEYVDLRSTMESAPYFYNLKVIKRTPVDSFERRSAALRA